MRAVITVIGKDMVGILARVSNICAEHQVNVLEVTQSILQDLFAMTPYFWKTPREGGERLEKADFLRTEIQFDFLVYRKAEEA